MNVSMNITPVLYIAGAALGFLGLAAALITARSMRRWGARCRSLEMSLAALRRELDLVASVSARTGQRVERVEHDYSGIAERIDLVERKGSAPSFDRAIDYARRGADSGKLTQQFGLSRGEADLVTLLHGRKKSA